MEANLAEGMDIDVQSIMTGRGCAIGQSGSGKSFLAGVIAEELCMAGMPFCVIDTEGEYSSLKTIANVIVVGGERGDLSLDVDFSKLFNASIANDVPVIIDLSDVLEKKDAAYPALQALYELENKTRKPYLVIIEEADKLAPQIGSKKINIVEEISVRGRKRGIGLFITTQRPANVSKNVLAQCSYGFIGKLTIENDLNALRILVNSSKKLASITRLNTGQFMPFGLDSAESFRVKPRAAKHMGSTPSIDEYKPEGSKIPSILLELKSGKTVPAIKGSKKAEAGTCKIALVLDTLAASFTEADARAYAEKVSKRRFIIFGSPTEKLDSLSLKYMPIGLYRLRFPTSHKNEYTEYSCVVSGKNELVRFGNGIKLLKAAEDLKESRRNYKNYLSKTGITVPDSREQATKDDIISAINEKNAKARITRLFPHAILVDFRIVYIPVYRITLRKGNTVRVFHMDAVYGKKIDI